MSKIPLGIVISHMSVDEGNYPKSSLEAFRDLVHQLDNWSKGNIKIAFDYEGFEDIGKNNSSQGGILKTIKDLNKKYNHLLFFRLVDPSYGEGMRTEYDYIRTLNKKLDDKKQIAVRTLVRKYNEDEKNFSIAENTWKELTDKKNQKLDVSWRYEDDNELQAKAREMITNFYLSKTGKKPKTGGKPSIWILFLFVLLGFLIWRYSGSINNWLYSNHENGVVMDSVAVTDSTDIIIPTPKPQPAEKKTNSTVWTDELKLEKEFVYIDAAAKGISGKDIPINGKIKGMISGLGLKATTNKNQALWALFARGSVIDQNEVDGFFFAWVNIDLEIINTVTGEVIHSGSLADPISARDGIKGGSVTSYDDAVSKAYQNSYPLIQQYINKIKNK